ncbi:hypothetical protein DL767_008196 [Monosporascus sp. MG133]|nr:hypothetical protein DL767_008196 [Monosporascus sp. MG133]
MPPTLRPCRAPPVFGRHVLWALLDFGIDGPSDDSESRSHKEHVKIAATTGAQEYRQRALMARSTVDGTQGAENELAALDKALRRQQKKMRHYKRKLRAAKAKQWEAVETMEPS